MNKEQYAKRMLYAVSEYYDRFPEDYEIPIMTSEHHILLQIKRYDLGDE